METAINQDTYNKRGNSKDVKNNGIENSIKKFCNYCNYPYKKGKLIKCSNCEKLFCKQCLTDVGKRSFFCISCCINMLRNNVDLLIVNDSSNIKKKRTIKIPLNECKKFNYNEKQELED